MGAAGIKRQTPVRNSKRRADGRPTGEIEPPASLPDGQHLAAMYAALSATNEAILHAKTTEELYQRVCEAAVEGDTLMTTAVIVSDPGIPSATVVAAAGKGALQLRQARISVNERALEGQALVEAVFRACASCISNPFLIDEPARLRHEPAEKSGAGAGTAVPLIQDGRTIGVLLFFSDARHAFDDQIVTLIERMAKNIVFAIDNFRREAERQRTEQALRESEERFRALTNLSSDWYWEQDAAFRFTRMESRHADKGEIRDLLLGKRAWEAGFEIHAEGGWEAHRALLAAHAPFRDVIMYHMRDNGKPYYFSVSGEPVSGKDGRVIGYRGVSHEITGQKMAEERIQYLATHDILTGLPNRALFCHLLNSTTSTAKRYQRNFAVLFIGLDRFKFINDTLGHEAGDALLQEIAARFKKALRASDVIARLGGDEFVVLVQEMRSRSQVETVARKLLTATAEPIVLKEHECRVTSSIGVAMYPADGQDEHALMKNADIAMYFAKEEGKNDFQFYSKDIKTQSLERLTLEANLRHALARHELSLHYQAKLDLKKGAITGVEALLRWQNSTLGPVSPIRFIPVAEETGLIVPIGKWVLHAACAQNVAWQRQGLPPICMAVNLSVRQFADPNLLDDIAAVLRDTGMAPHLLELEITEGMVIHDSDRAVKLLTAIKQLGVRLAIDDFGTGYSSLGQLKYFPIDTLKVDRSFIRDIATSPGDKAITKAIIAMGKTLSLTVVAEGVETLEQANFLREHACDEMQGYYFSKPVTANEFAIFLRSHLTLPKE